MEVFRVLWALALIFDIQELIFFFARGSRRADDVLHRGRWRRPFFGAHCSDEDTPCTLGDVRLIYLFIYLFIY
jgi:hypothetical protein